VNPSEVPVGTGKTVQLSLLAVPKDGQREEAHQVGDELGEHRKQGVPEVLLAVNGLPRRVVEIKHQQRHRDGENAVTNRCQTFDTLTRDLVTGSVGCRRLRLVHTLTQKLCCPRTNADLFC